MEEGSNVVVRDRVYRRPFARRLSTEGVIGVKRLEEHRVNTIFWRVVIHREFFENHVTFVVDVSVA